MRLSCNCGVLLFYIWSIINSIIISYAHPITKRSSNSLSQQQQPSNTMDNSEDNHSEHVIRHRHRAIRRLASSRESINTTSTMYAVVRTAENSDLPIYECPAGFLACQPLHQRVLCINTSQLCDHVVDCPGGEDEDFTSCMHTRARAAEVEVLKSKILLLERENLDYRSRIKQYIDCKSNLSMDRISYHLHDQENRVHIPPMEEGVCERQLDTT